MTLDLIWRLLRWVGGILALLALLLMYAGIWRGARQPSGSKTGRIPGLLHSRLFYLAASIAYFGICFWLWKPIPLTLPGALQPVVLAVGAVVYFSGIAFLLWARLTLGRMYFVSTGFGAQLFAGHQLITHGPFAIVRHPMYLGISIAALGGLLLYQTWTLFVFLLLPLGLARRARVEERVLESEFGDQWRLYCRRVPAFFPKLGKRISV